MPNYMYRECNPFWRKIGSIFQRQRHSHKFLRCKPLARSGDMVPNETMKFCKFSFSSSHCVKWQFLHFHTILVVFYKVFIIITVVFGFFFAVVNPMFRNRETFFTAFTAWPLWKIIINLMCARHKCIQRKATLVWALLDSVLSLQTL